MLFEFPCGRLTLLHPGNSQAWTRFPFLALLMRCVVGVYVMGRGMSAMLFVRRIISVSADLRRRRFLFFIFEVGESGSSRRWRGRMGLLVEVMAG